MSKKLKKASKNTKKYFSNLYRYSNKKTIKKAKKFYKQYGFYPVE